MSCDNQGLIGRINNISTPKIVVGADAFVVTQVLYKGSDDDYAFDNLSGCTGSFQGGSDGQTPVNVIGSVVSADKGLIRFDFPASATESLYVGEQLSFQQTFEDARGKTIILFDAALDVVDSLF